MTSPGPVPVTPDLQRESLIDPRDEAVMLEVAHRMQSRWTGADMRSATLTAAMLARATALLERGEQRLLPAESIALTVALAQVQRGEDATSNVAAMCILALARIDGRYDYTTETAHV